MLSLLSLCAVASNPPVLGWSNQQGVFAGADSIRAGAAVPVSVALKNHINLGTRNAVVFAQDQLSVEDITRHGAVFGGQSSFGSIKTAMDAAVESIVLPSVSSPLGTATDLAKSLGGNLREVSVADVADGLPADIAAALASADESTVVVCKLPTVAGAANPAAAYKLNDEAVGKIFNLLAAADKSIVALLTAEAETPLYGAIRQAALALPDVDEVEASEEGLEVNYDLLRSRRNVAEVQAAERPRSAAARECKQWPQQARTYPNPNHPQQQGSKTCKPPHMFGTPQRTEYFGTPILMGITVSALIISVMMCGVFNLMVLQTNSKYPSVDDAAIIVSTANE